MSGQRNFYVTTPIYYINDAPHVGHAYTTIVCDALARHHRLRGRPTHFLTGTDEHGQKAARSAEKQGLGPLELADRNVKRYQEAWKALGISHDDFLRTTEERHVKGAQAFWSRIAESGDIYKSSYSGPYCVGCEAYYPASQLVEGRCPEAAHHEIQELSEESYFFRLSKYQERLLELYHRNPEFVTPRSRLNEVLRFVEGGLDDLSISRTSFTWGVPVPGDDKHVMYVWIEALSNYITALGYGSADESLFRRLWPAELQVVGKDILRFHAVFWPAFLMAAGLEPPKQVLAHGWWQKDGEKMSKTKGNVADPFDLVTWFGRDPVRWFLLKEIQLGADGSYSEEALIDRTNTDLANDLGNTLSRVSKLVESHLGGRVPKAPAHSPAGGADRGDGTPVLDPRQVAQEAWPAWSAAFEAAEPQAALRAAWTLLDVTNKFLVREEPWKLAKDESAAGRLGDVLHEAAEALRHVALMISPAIPDTSARLYATLGLGEPPSVLPFDPEGPVPWGFPQGGSPLVHGEPLFPRIDKKAFFAGLEEARAAAPSKSGERPAKQPVGASGPKDGPKGEAKGSARDDKRNAKEARGNAKDAKLEAEEQTGLIGIEDVMKVKLRTAVVKGAKKHPDADKLIVLELDDGSPSVRTICAGVAAWYAPEDLVGKTIVIVANLKPRPLRGIPSQGMLLAANFSVEGRERVHVITLPEGTPAGAEVR